MKKVVVLFLSLILIVGLSMPTFALADTSLETTTSQAEFFSFAYDDMTNEIAYHIRNGEKRFTVVREVQTNEADLYNQIEVSVSVERLTEYSARDCAARPLKLSIHSGGIEHACRRR